jgi:6-pyruvoyltetrahydropterin/6-carboxytetrahydropterin synthase
MEGRRLMKKVSFSRVYSFSSSHRLHSPTLDDNANLDVYDKCNNLNGHGHDYKLEVTLHATPDPETGMVYPLDAFDHAVNAVLQVLDYRHLDKEVPFFKEHISTGEVIIGYLWNEIKDRLPGGLLHHLRLWETNNNYFDLGKEN